MSKRTILTISGGVIVDHRLVELSSRQFLQSITGKANGGTAGGRRGGAAGGGPVPIYSKGGSAFIS